MCSCLSSGESSSNDEMRVLDLDLASALETRTDMNLTSDGSADTTATFSPLARADAMACGIIWREISRYG